VRAARQLAIRAALALLCLALPRSGSAYDPRPGHERLAQTAIEGFNLCVAADTLREYSLASYALRDYAALIIEADVAEDEQNLVRRALNWHFHGVESSREIGLVDESLNRVFAEIEAEIAVESIQAVDAYELVGRAMHFLEDMTVPSHVVPVYHGPGFPRSIVDTVDIHRVQGMAPGRLLWAELAKVLPESCEQLASALGDSRKSEAELISLRVILDQTAEATRRGRLASPICKSADPELVWRRFWVQPKAGSFFGSYADDTPEFGHPGAVVSASGASCTLTHVEYDRFVLEGHRQAVLADIRALFWVSRTVYGSPN
jgi:hypothetical protein